LAISKWNHEGWMDRFMDPSQKDVAFRELVEHFQKDLYHHIKRMILDHQDTDDILQDTFVKAWVHLADFRGDSQIKTWLYKVATNETLSFIRKKRNTQSLDTSILEPVSVSGFTEDESEKLILKLEQAIAILPDRQRAVFCMRYYDDMPYQEIAKITGLTEGALKASYFHAVKKVEEFITAVKP